MLTSYLFTKINKERKINVDELINELTKEVIEWALTLSML